MTDFKAVFAELEEVRRRYDDAHSRAMTCLESRDLNGFDEILREESELIAQQARLIAKLRGL